MTIEEYNKLPGDIPLSGLTKHTLAHIRDHHPRLAKTMTNILRPYETAKADFIEIIRSVDISGKTYDEYVEAVAEAITDAIGFIGLADDYDAI